MSSNNTDPNKLKDLRDNFLRTLKIQANEKVIAGFRLRITSQRNSLRQTQDNPNKAHEEGTFDSNNQPYKSHPEADLSRKNDQKSQKIHEDLTKAIMRLTTNFNNDSNANQLETDLRATCIIVAFEDELPMQLVLDTQILDILIQFLNDYFKPYTSLVCDSLWLLVNISGTEPGAHAIKEKNLQGNGNNFIVNYICELAGSNFPEIKENAVGLAYNLLFEDPAFCQKF
jgi:hypothetical protein